MLLSQLGFVLIGFLSGSVLFSYHIPMWLKHIDVVKESKDHNPGTSNAFHYAGVNIGILCLMADLAKSFLPVFYSVHCLGFPYALLPLVMAAPVAGHAFSPWYGFHGGKGVAVTCTWLILYLPVTGLLCCLAGGAAVLLWGYLPVGAVLIPLLAIPLAGMQYGTEAGVGTALAAAIMFSRHAKGLWGVWQGTEPRFFQ